MERQAPIAALEQENEELRATLRAMGVRDGEHLRRMAALERKNRELEDEHREAWGAIRALAARFMVWQEELPDDDLAHAAEVIGIAYDAERKREDSRLAKLDALLASEEPPEELVRIFQRCLLKTITADGLALAAWRWLQEHFGATEHR